MGLRVLPPDVNESQTYFTPTDGDIRYGLAAVRNVGEGVVQQIIAGRQEGGPFQSFTDFCRRVDPGVLHKKCMESLILAGAFDSMGYTRQGLLEGYEKVITPILADRRAEALGQESFFGGDAGPLLDIDESVLAGEEFDRPEFLRSEKEMLGQYVTDHPLLGIKERLAAQTDLDISDVGSLGDGDVVRVAGIVAALARRYTKRGEPYAVLRLEDLTGGVGIVAFPSVYDAVGSLLTPDGILVVKGRADLRGRELQLVALEISEPDLGAEALAGSRRRTMTSDPLVLDLTPSTCTGGLIGRLKGLLSTHPGQVPVVFRLVENGEATRLRLGEEYRVDGSPALLSELHRLLGREAARFEETSPVASARPTG
jgi:DNA polymerase-3 subunit alpha